MIGSKTIATSLLLLAALVVFFSSGMTLEESARLDPTSVFWAGLAAVVGGSLAFRFLRFDRFSRHYFRFAREDFLREGESHFVNIGHYHVFVGTMDSTEHDFPVAFRRFVFIFLALGLALESVGRNTVSLISELPEKLMSGKAQTCPDPEEAAKNKKPEPPGCALVRRAYELGYAKDLGDCAGEEDDEDFEPCNLRQWDEPILHYAMRLMRDTLGTGASVIKPEYWVAMWDSFMERYRSSETLYESHRQMVDSWPRSSHHVWTNLPSPRGFLDDVSGGAFERSDCVHRFQRLEHQPPDEVVSEKTPSHVFEHIMGQLLFETRYQSAAAMCREFYIHWDAPMDACDRLREAPEDFLKESGAWTPVDQVMSRYTLQPTIAQLELRAAEIEGALLGGEEPQEEEAEQKEEKKEEAPQKATISMKKTSLQSVVTFHCYFEQDRPEASHTSGTLNIGEHEFVYSEMRVPYASTQDQKLERYDHVATLLAPEFEYGTLIDTSRINPESGNAVQDTFAQGDNALAKLNHLVGADVFQGNRWILQRPDLMEIYPYHVHLGNFVQRFRNQYRRSRGRL